MKISEFIKRLEDLKEVAGDVEVTVADPENGYYKYEQAAAEIANVTKDSKLNKWHSYYNENNTQVIAIW